MKDSDFLNELRYFKRTEFPDWIPLGALLMLEWSVSALRERKEIDSRHNNLIELHQRIEMKYSWGKVLSLFPEDANWGGAWFSCALAESIPDPGTKYRPVPAAKAKKWQTDLSKSLIKSAKISDNTPSNFRYWGSEFEHRLVHYLYSTGFHHIPDHELKIAEFLKVLPAPNILLELIRESITVAYNHDQRDLYGSQPESTGSIRLYFIRALTSCMLQACGKPCRKIVADAASLIFDCQVSEREVIRMAKGTTKESIIHGVSASTINLVLYRKRP